MRVLVIGGNGYIGNRLVDYLVEQQYDITIVDRNDYVSKELLDFNLNYSQMVSSLLYIKASYASLVDSFFKSFDSIVFLVNDFDFVELYHLLKNLEPHQKFIFGKFEPKDDLLYKLTSMIHSKHYCLDFGNLYGHSRNFKDSLIKRCHINYFCEAVVIIIKRGGFNCLFDLGNFETSFSYKFKYVSDTLSDQLILMNREAEEKYEFSGHCLVCNESMSEFFNIGELPLDDHYHDNNTICDTRDISLYYCANCFHVQANGTAKIVNSEFDKQFLYNLAIYSLTRLGYFNNHQSDFKENESVKILIIGGEGQAEIYKHIESQWGVKFDLRTCHLKEIDQLLVSSNDIFDIINFFNFDHVSQLHETLALLKHLVNKDGLIFLQSSSNINTLRTLFNGIDCHRLSYFSINSMKKLCTDTELYLNNANDIDSQYYVYELANRIFDTNLDELLYKDICLGIYGDEYYKTFNVRMKIFKNSLQNKLYEYKLLNKTIIGYGYNGALLNYCNIDSDFLEWIVDDSIPSADLLSPVSDVPIRTSDSIIGLENIVILKMRVVDLSGTIINPFV